jgi:hypothetical protein
LHESDGTGSSTERSTELFPLWIGSLPALPAGEVRAAAGRRSVTRRLTALQIVTLLREAEELIERFLIHTVELLELLVDLFELLHAVSH